MINSFTYIIQANLAMIILYGIWQISSGRKMIPRLNRITLLCIACMTLGLPLVSFSLPEKGGILNNLTNLYSSDTVMSYSNNINSHAHPDKDTTASILALIRIIWLSGVLVGSLLLIISTAKKLKLVFAYGIKRIHSHYVVPVEAELQPFSFMRLIFVNFSRYNRESLQALILHESAHIRQLHYADLIFLEFFRLFFWYNPVSWILYRKIQENHEYLADSYVLERGVNKLKYFGLILEHINPAGISTLESSFSRLITIKRLKMMNTIINKKKKLYHILFSLLSFIFIFLAFGFTNAKHTSEKGINEKTNPVMEEFSDPPTIAPLNMDKVKVTSGFGMRMHPVKKVKMMHKGIDLAAPEGTDVYATADGKVIDVDYKPQGSGRLILIRHDDQFETFYSQLSSVLVEEGDKVKKGSVIGKVGRSGMSTGPHLHYEVRKDGEAIDPINYF